MQLGGEDSFRYVSLTLVAMRFAYQLKTRNGTTHRYALFTEHNIRSELASVLENGCLDSQKSSQFVPRDPRRYRMPIFHPEKDPLSQKLDATSRAYVFYATLVLWHLCSAAIVGECIVSHEYMMVFWVPELTRLGGCSLYGVPSYILRCSRPCGSLVGRSGHPLCLCPCMAHEFMFDCKGHMMRDVLRPWHHKTHYRADDAGTVWMSNRRVVLQSGMVLLVAFLLGAAYPAAAIWASNADKRNSTRARKWSDSLQAVYPAVLAFFVVIRGCAELISNERTMKDIFLFRRKISSFNDLIDNDDQRILLLKRLMYSREGPGLGAKDRACYLSSGCTGKYAFREVTVADLHKCAPVIAGKDAFVWVDEDGINVCTACMTRGDTYRFDHKTTAVGRTYCTKRVHGWTPIR